GGRSALRLHQTCRRRRRRGLGGGPLGPRAPRHGRRPVVTSAVVFDLDGVLVDSETVWDEARRDVVASCGGSWRPEATRAMMGMSSPEWAAYLRDELGVARPVPEIIDG